MAKSKKAEIERERRDKGIYDGYLRDCSQFELGKLFSVSQSTVSRSIRKYRDALVKADMVSSKALTVECAGRIDAVRRQAWRHFEASGEACFLKIILDCVRSTRDLFGLDPAKGISIHNVDDFRVEFRHRVIRSRREYEELKALKEG